MPVFWFFAKLMALLFGTVWLRASLPRLRYDQLMDLGWKALIPLAFGWLLIISLLRLAQDHDWNVGLAAVCGFAVGAVCWALLAAAIAVAKRNRLEAGETF
jgi:NADH-quinone oxidoreductase subunit H